MKLILSLLLVIPGIGFATPTKKQSATDEEKAFFNRGHNHMKKLVSLCQQKEFNSAAYDAAMIDPSMAATYKALEAPRGSDAHKNAFAQYKAYLCGMRSALNSYKPQRRNPQDAVVKYNKKNIMAALNAPDWETILENNRRESARFMSRMQEVRWEVLAQVA